MKPFWSRPPPLRPVVIDLPKDVLMNKTDVYQKKSDIRRIFYKPRIKGDLGQPEGVEEGRPASVPGW